MAMEFVNLIPIPALVTTVGAPTTIFPFIKPLIVPREYVLQGVLGQIFLRVLRQLTLIWSVRTEEFAIEVRGYVNASTGLLALLVIGQNVRMIVLVMEPVIP